MTMRKNLSFLFRACPGWFSWSHAAAGCRRKQLPEPMPAGGTPAEPEPEPEPAPASSTP